MVNKLPYETIRDYLKANSEGNSQLSIIITRDTDEGVVKTNGVDA